MAEETENAGKFGVVTVEVGNDRNDTILYAPTQEPLRGRFEVHNMGQSVSSVEKGVTNMPSIPGVRLSLDCRKGVLRLTDPLADPKNKALLEKISKVGRNADLTGGRDYAPRPDVEKSGLDASAVASHLYWMMRMVEAKNARVLEGRMPRSEEEIIKSFPGCVIRKDYYNAVRDRT
jgi:hypothetical protein